MGLLGAIFGGNKANRKGKTNATAAAAKVPAELTVTPEDLIERVVNPYVEATGLDSLKITWTIEPCSIIDSKAGGTPYWPAGRAYPTTQSGVFAGRGIKLLAQINFEQMPHLEGFPETGLLQFFAADDDVTGLDFDDMFSQNAMRVVYHPQVSLDDPQGKIPDVAIDGYYPVEGEYRMNFERVRRGMSPTDYRYDESGRALFAELLHTAFPEMSDIDGVFDLPDGLYRPVADLLLSDGGSIGGYGYFTQEDPRGYMADAENATIQLLQIDSVFGKGNPVRIMWGDSGVANFFISPEDLAALDFSHVLYTWDCC